MNFLPFGTVYGALMNHASEWDALAEAMHAPPYQAPPRAPVLYIKPANTWTPSGRPIALPPDVPEAEVGATVGLVMGGPNQPAQIVLMADLSAPQTSWFRPPVRANAIDGFLGVGATPAPLPAPDALAALALEVLVNGQPVQTVRLADLRRSPAQLVADIGAFMTLRTGDVLMPGCALPRPRVRAGDRLEVRCTGLPPLVHDFVVEAAPAEGAGA